MINRIRRIARGCCAVAALSGAASDAGAATREEVQRLDAAYPPGSVVVCRADLPGDGRDRLPTRLESRVIVVTRTADQTVGRGTVSWITGGHTSPGLTLTFTVTQRKSESGYYSRIDPASMVVSMPGAGPEGEKLVLDGMRQRLPAGEEFAPFSQTEITDFPSYITRKPGEPPIYCHKEKQE
ncbi:hypothetical protein [Mixta intestinalis]|uniref:Uncharacterized protein n=1 Tax=Mixta intestinalis TaxID=1615494 RepID=A0A6P1Q522_9GAMM|nr:hypothetical protein [Mixta intestinalis]QHM74066.1 hypothetical protein C7M51_04427 [Mixta intestinalis]